MIILVSLSGVYFVTSFVRTFETVFGRCTSVYMFVCVYVNCMCVSVGVCSTVFS